MESTLTIQELIKKAKQEGYEALALTDHNVLYGAIEFYEMALKNNIKPIIGLTLDVEGFIMKNESYPLLLLAKNFEGYQALIQLSSMYQLNDQNAVPLAEIIVRNEHLIVISPGDQGEIISLLQNKRIAEAQEVLQYFKENIKDFYLGISLQDSSEESLSFYKQNRENLVALGNVQYLEPKDALPTKILQVLKSDMPLGSENQARINQFLSENDRDYSLKSPDEVVQQFSAVDLEEACQATKIIAENTNLKLTLNEHIMPTYPVPEGKDSAQYLKALCDEALEQRVEEVTEAYVERLEKELKVITTMGFSDYFLIVWDIIRYAHRQKIYTGSGRGSAAGSLVAYLLKITNVDPIQYNLLFERFLNEERYTMPDIDLDFPDNRREEILTYIYDKYGRKNVAQIGTIGTYGAKSAVRDVARVLGASQEEIKRWAKAIPSGPNVSLENGIKNQDLQNLIRENARNQKIYEIAKSIEGRNRHISTHAAAVVIADHPVIEQTPLQKGSGSIHLTQYTMEAVEKVGLLKLDILGLRNLSILADCIRFIPYENKGEKIDIDQIPFDDQKTLEIFRKGNTDGVFQFESAGIRRVLRKLQPNSFEDVVAVNALYRPGPMEQIDTFIRRKNGEEPIKYPHDDLKDILGITYGVMVYQEQVMQVASIMAGYTLNEADILRRAISKKSHKEIEKGRQQFVQGSIENNYSKETALEVYGYIERFADYGFNRSHAVAYSKVAYQLAYIKANYPASFFAAIMKASNKDKIKTYKTESKQYGVELLAPDINKSYSSFTVERGKIRFGLDIIKGLPKNFVREIIKERRNNGDYVNIVNFLNRIDEKWLNKEIIFPLINSGAFDKLKENRNSLIHSLPSIIDSIKMSHGNVELFDIFAPVIEQKTEISDEEKMKQEYEATDFYFTSEPGEKYNELRKDQTIKYLTDISKDTYVRLLVTVENIKNIQTKKGQPMSFVDVADSTGKGNLTLFPNVHRQYIQKFDQGDTILIDGKVEQTKYPAKIIVNKLALADDLLDEPSKQLEHSNEKKQVLYIRFESLKSEQKKFYALQELLLQNRGQTPVILYDQETKKQKPFKQNYNVKVNVQILEQLNKMFGEKNIVLKNS